MKDPNTPLMAPGLLTGKIKAPPLTNGHIPNNNNSIIKRGDEIAKSLLESPDFKKLDSRLEDQVDISHMSTKIKTTTTTNTQETLTKTNTFETKPVSGFKSMANGNLPNQKKSIMDEDRNRNVITSSIADKKVKTKMEPVKEFGSFSPLNLPGLLMGKPATNVGNSTPKRDDSPSRRSRSRSKSPEISSWANQDYSTSKMTEDSSTFKKSFASRTSNEETSKKDFTDDISSNRMFSTTISKTVKDARSNSFVDKTGSNAEASFVISTDPEVKRLKPVTGTKQFEPITSQSSFSYKSKETETRSSLFDSSKPRLSSPVSKPVEPRMSSPIFETTERERKTSEQERKTSVGTDKAFIKHTISSASKINAIAPAREGSKSPVRISISPGRRSKSPEIPNWANKDYSATSEMTSAISKKSSYSTATSSAAAASSLVKKSSSTSRTSPGRSLIPRRTSDAGSKSGGSQNAASPLGSRNSKGIFNSTFYSYPPFKYY